MTAPVLLTKGVKILKVAAHMQEKYNVWKSAFFLFLFYFCAHFLLIFSKVVMWDGWLWLNLLKQKDYETLYSLFNQAGLAHIYAVYRVIETLGNPVAIANILVFISWFIAGICVYLILKNFAKIGEKNSFFAASVFLLVPIFIVRFEISMITYSLSNGAFFLGAYMFLRSTAITRFLPRLTLQTLAAIFLISAFFTASFLVFYGGLILFAFFLFLKKESLGLMEVSKRWRDAIFRFLKKNIFWILLPVIFYLSHHKLIGTPHGIYEGYNSFIFSYSGMTFMGFWSLFFDRAFQFIVYGFFGPIIFSVSILQRKIFFAIFLAIFFCISFLEKKFNLLSVSGQENQEDAAADPKNIFRWGTLFFAFGSLAYVLVGESPNPYGSGFDMRQGLILPLGVTLVILSFVNGFLNNKIRKPAKLIMLAVFITYNIYNYYTLDMDRYKQIGIIESLREEHDLGHIGEREIFVFYDKMPLYKWRGRSIKEHEYTAYLYEATGNPKLMGTSVGEDLRYVGIVKKDELVFDDRRTRERFKNIVIRSGANSQEPMVKNWVKLKLADLFGEEDELSVMVKNIIGVNTLISAEVPKEASWFGDK